MFIIINVSGRKETGVEMGTSDHHEEYLYLKKLRTDCEGKIFIWERVGNYVKQQGHRRNGLRRNIFDAQTGVPGDVVQEFPNTTCPVRTGHRSKTDQNMPPKSPIFLWR